MICSFRLSGLSPFMGENDNDTYANINRANFDYDDEAFTDISDEAKDFISKLLIKDKE
jgi:myosin-light-chain kinase